MAHEAPASATSGRRPKRLLRAPTPMGRLPTPVDDIVAAAGLVEPGHSLLSDFVLAQAPAHLRDEMRKLRLKVRAPSSTATPREIHVDPGIRIRGQIAFKKLHEVGHDICWWQRDRGYADDDETLSWSMDQRPGARGEPGSRRTAVSAQILSGRGGPVRDRDRVDPRSGRADRVVGACGIPALHRNASVGARGRRSWMDRPRSRDPLAYQRREVVCSAAWEERFGSLYSWPSALQPMPYSFITRCPEAARTRSVARRHVPVPPTCATSKST